MQITMHRTSTQSDGHHDSVFSKPENCCQVLTRSLVTDYQLLE